MSSALQRAITNNIGIYQAILGAQGISFQVDPDLAYTTEKVPPYYSNAVTRSEDWRPDMRFERMGQAGHTGHWADWSIKDSHDVLDLTRLGFTRLFRATWIHFDPGDLVSPMSQLTFDVAQDEEALARWREGWDAEPEPARTLFGPAVLRDPHLHFVSGYIDNMRVGGCLFNETGEDVGISNFFATGDRRSIWAGAVGHILDQLGPRRVIGYTRDEVLPDFQAIGFQKLGPLSVWHCPSTPESKPR